MTLAWTGEEISRRPAPASLIRRPQISPEPAVAASRPVRLTRGPEAGLMLLTIAALGLIAVLGAATGQQVAWASIASSHRLNLILLVVAFILRALRRAEGWALALIAVALFRLLGTTLIHLSYFRFPFGEATGDLLLERVDALMGYSWPAAVALAADWPAIARPLAAVYHSSIPQLALVVVVLAATGRHLALHRFMVTSALTLAGTYAIWALMPTLGPAVLHPVDPAVAESIRLVVNERYVAAMLSLAQDGPGVIGAGPLIGAVAFPSFHMIMACLATWSLRGTVLGWPVFALNLLVVPATLLHGGHHLVDLVGGLLLFALCVRVAARLVPEPRP